MSRHSWFKRHARFISFAGALIVFVTFITKEGLREHWRGIADAVDTAQYIYGIRVEVEKARRTLTFLEQEIGATQELVNSTANRRHDEPYDNIARNLRTLQGEDDAIGITLRNLGIITEKLPQPDGNRMQLERLTLDLANVRAQRVSLKQIIDPPPSPDKLTVGALDTTTAAQELVPLWSAIQKLDGETRNLVYVVQKDAGEVRAKNALYSTWAWWISVLLYTIGWGLGLAGRLHGVEGFPTSE